MDLTPSATGTPTRPTTRKCGALLCRRPHRCPPSGEAGKNRAQLRRTLRQLLRQDAGFSDDGHEVRVAVPARHDVHVDMIEHTGARRLAEIDAHVETVWVVGLTERDFRT